MYLPIYRGIYTHKHMPGVEQEAYQTLPCRIALHHQRPALQPHNLRVQHLPHHLPRQPVARRLMLRPLAPKVALGGGELGLQPGELRGLVSARRRERRHLCICTCIDIDVCRYMYVYI